MAAVDERRRAVAWQVQGEGCRYAGIRVVGQSGDKLR